MQLDIDRLIAYFGGVNALAEALKQQDPEHAASTAAIYKWRTRGSLPLAQLQKLTALAQAQGRPLDLNAFIHQQAELEKNTMNTNNRVIIYKIHRFVYGWLTQKYQINWNLIIQIFLIQQFYTVF